MRGCGAVALHLLLLLAVSWARAVPEAEEDAAVFDDAENDDAAFESDLKVGEEDDEFQDAAAEDDAALESDLKVGEEDYAFDDDAAEDDSALESDLKVGEEDDAFQDDALSPMERRKRIINLHIHKPFEGIKLPKIRWPFGKGKGKKG